MADLAGSFRKGWIVTTLTVRYMLTTRRGIVTAALAWLPLLLTGSLALARVPSFGLDLFQRLMVPLFLQIVLIFVTLVSATALIREEIDDGTLPYLLTRPVSKPVMAVGKYAGYLLAGWFLLLPPLAISFVVADAYGGMNAVADLSVLEGFLAATALGVLAYGAFFYFLSVILRKPLMVGLLVGFIWESIVGSLPGSVPKLSLIFYLRSVLKGVVAVGPSAEFSNGVSASLAAAVLIGFSLVMLVLVAFLFQRMEFQQKA